MGEKDNHNLFVLRRRNLMAINLLLLIINVSEINIDLIKIFNITFVMKDNPFLFNSYKEILLLMWLYFNVVFMVETSSLNLITRDKRKDNIILVLIDKYNPDFKKSFNFLILKGALRIGRILFNFFFKPLSVKYAYPIYFSILNIFFMDFSQGLPLAILLFLSAVVIYNTGEGSLCYFKHTKNKFKVKYDEFKKTKTLKRK